MSICLSGSNVQILNLSDCKIGALGAINLFRLIQRTNTLKELNLSKNYLDGQRLRSVKEMLHANKSLQVLNLNSCLLGEQGAFYLAQGLV